VLFYSPQCGHCHYVIEEVLPPLVQKHGAQLEVIGVDVSQPQGSQYFQAALQMFSLQSSGVPFLVIGDEYLIGSVDIPEKFPGLIEKYLIQGGVDYPDIPGLREELYASQTAQAPTPAPTEAVAQNPPDQPVTPSAFGLASQSQPSVWERVARDPLGNGLAIVVLLGMLGTVAFTIMRFAKLESGSPADWQLWLFPILTLAGFIVAGYLAYVETSQVTAVCGPVGDCNTVQQSEYARLFGILPIGVLGLAGYVFILLAWVVGRLKQGKLSNYADLSLLVMTGFGLTFSVYLTFLEPFVIGATCAWCLTSAVLMTLLFLLSLKPGKLAYSNLFA